MFTTQVLSSIEVKIWWGVLPEARDSLNGPLLQIAEQRHLLFWSYSLQPCGLALIRRAAIAQNHPKAIARF
ncbi:hypothetical protein AVDCRST_MAG81-5369 [uncultured Synechococcales cyanobacterium]|uniref:Uncharacterized protein n=1 Tax=uncultured Synechococcales cyanobacterium TaxID=1936017 RepID=A0A6J4VYV7_9CYAN|nr:hypothetical protein AVDCRST_MAG81-5369 [uncultured Synechococcales cyanobacterium]